MDLSTATTTNPVGQQLQYVIGRRDDCDEESKDREKHNDTYNEGLCIATEGENIPVNAEILECYDDRRSKKKDLHTSACLACRNEVAEIPQN
jgi:hypothetical protein